MSDDNKSTLDTSDIEDLVVNVVNSLQKAAAGIDKPDELKRADWPKIKSADTGKISRQIQRELTQVRKTHEKGVKKRKSELNKALEIRRKRLESAAIPKPPVVREKPGSFIVSGRVVDKEEGVGLPNVVVKVFDANRELGDRLGKTRTDEDGYYLIEYSEKEFKEVFEKQPETHIEVLDSAGNNLYTSKRSFVHKAGASESIDAKVDGNKLEGSLTWAKKRQLITELQRKETEERISKVRVKNLRLPVKIERVVLKNKKS